MAKINEALSGYLSNGVRRIRFAEQGLDDDGVTVLPEGKREQRIMSATRGLHINIKRILTEGLVVDATILQDARNVHGEYIYRSIAFHDELAKTYDNRIQFRW